ncbi:MAG TPA: hypothetical protein VNZ52_12515 [Candidatus Thermoplasmatota archaeon]|nr:hypothetical protein [Candidatus Thermoplasmatota archaeon]
MVRIDLPVVQDLRARGVSRNLAHAQAADLARAVLRVVGPETATLACTGEAPGLLDRLRGVRPGPLGLGAGWRAEMPTPAWSEADLWRALAGLSTPRL